MSGYTLPGAALALVAGFAVGYLGAGLEVADRPAPVVVPSAPTPPSPRSTAQQKAPSDSSSENHQEVARLDRILASLPQPDLLDPARFPDAHSAAAFHQRLADVDSALDGPGLPHGARFVDVDCNPLPCLVVLYMPTYEGGESRGTGPGREATYEVVDSFSDWMDVQGDPESSFVAMGGGGGALFPIYWVPPGLPNEERWQLQADMQSRLLRTSVWERPGL